MNTAPAVAPWWQPGGDSPVRAHTPDPNKYHDPMAVSNPDTRAQLPLGSEPGARGAMIPRSRPDGSSRGFDGTKAGVVHVDPNAPDGGRIVDMSQLKGPQVNEAIARANPNIEWEKRHEPYYLLGVAPGPKADVAPPSMQAAVSRVNPVIPDAYVVPSSNMDGNQVAPQAGNQQLAFIRSRMHSCITDSIDKVLRRKFFHFSFSSLDTSLISMSVRKYEMIRSMAMRYVP